jgi:hypothetical protein
MQFKVENRTKLKLIYPCQVGANPLWSMERVMTRLHNLSNFNLSGWGKYLGHIQGPWGHGTNDIQRMRTF